jgi:hypothetical protein
MSKRDAVWTLMTLMGVIGYVACGGRSTDDSVTAPAVPALAETGSVTAQSAIGSIERQGNLIVFTIEGGLRGDGFMAQLWDKGQTGISRDGRPVFEQRGLGNGTLVVDATQWSCLDLQADLGGIDGGLLVFKQFAAWAPCPAPTPKPRPTPPPGEDACPNLEGIQERVPQGMELDEEGNCVPCPPPPSCETNPELCPPPVDVCPNVEGVQETLPEGYYLAGDGNCYQIPPPPPPALWCYYEISGKQDDKPGKCAAQGGSWSSWYSESGHDHEQCRIAHPGVSLKGFNLNPGQSAEGCARKQDD